MGFSDSMEQDIVYRYLSGESSVVISREYGITKISVLRVLEKHQIERRKQQDRPMRSDAKLYEFDRAVLEKMVCDGMSIREIGGVPHIPSSRVHRACVSFGIALRDRKKQISAKTLRQIPDTLFAIPLNRHESWLLGFLMTDGCVGSEGHIKLSICDKDGTEIAMKIIGFGSIRESKPKISEYNGQKIHGTLPIWNYIACSKLLVERLNAIGLTSRKTKTLSFPNLSHIVLSDFIRGIWDGDGSWHINKRDNALTAHFGCASKQFVEALRPIFCEVTGSAATVRANCRNDFWQLSCQGKKAVALAQWLYYDNDVACLERKRLIVQPFL